MYNVFILPRAEKQLAKISSPYIERIEKACIELTQCARPFSAKKLVAREGWRIRINDYRVIYQIDDKMKRIIILDVGHRSSIYR